MVKFKFIPFNPLLNLENCLSLQPRDIIFVYNINTNVLYYQSRFQSLNLIIHALFITYNLKQYAFQQHIYTNSVPLQIINADDLIDPTDERGYFNIYTRNVDTTTTEAP